MGPQWAARLWPARLTWRPKRCVNAIIHWGRRVDAIVAVVAIAFVIGGCALFLPPRIECPDDSGWKPPPPLTCGEAVAAAIAALPPDHAVIETITFDWGRLVDCATHCPATMPSFGHVIFDFADGSQSYIEVTKSHAVVTVVSELTPLVVNVEPDG